MDLLSKGVGKMLKSVSLKAEGEMKMTKKILAGLVIGMMMSGVVFAATPSDYFKLTVTVSPDVSVWIGETLYAFGDMGTNETSISQTSIAVINDSAGLTEKYSIKASDAHNDGAHASPTSWTLAASTGTDTYSLMATFKADLPGDSDFEVMHDTLTNAAVTCDTTKFATGGTQDGYESIGGTEERLWFKISTPSSVKDTNEHTIFITVTAMEM